MIYKEQRRKRKVDRKESIEEWKQKQRKNNGEITIGKAEEEEVGHSEDMDEEKKDKETEIQRNVKEDEKQEKRLKNRKDEDCERGRKGDNNIVQNYKHTRNESRKRSK